MTNEQIMRAEMALAEILRNNAMRIRAAVEHFEYESVEDAVVDQLNSLQLNLLIDESLDKTELVVLLAIAAETIIESKS